LGVTCDITLSLTTLPSPSRHYPLPRDITLSLATLPSPSRHYPLPRDITLSLTFSYYGKMTLDVIGETAFGLDIDSQNNPEEPFLHAAKKVFRSADHKTRPFIFQLAGRYRNTWFFIFNVSFRMLTLWVTAFHYCVVLKWGRVKKVFSREKSDSLYYFSELSLACICSCGTRSRSYHGICSSNGDGQTVIDPLYVAQGNHQQNDCTKEEREG
jgi:hypothetical protein